MLEILKVNHKPRISIISSLDSGLFWLIECKYDDIIT